MAYEKHQNYKVIGKCNEETDFDTNGCLNNNRNYINCVNLGTQLVGTNGNLIFSENTMSSGKKISHAPNTSSFVISGYGVFNVYFKIVTSIPNGGILIPISVILELDGKKIKGAELEVSPSNVEQFHTLSINTLIEVPKNKISVLTSTNVTKQSIHFKNIDMILTELI